MDLFNSRSLFRQIHQNNLIANSVADSNNDFSTISNVLIHQTLVLRENLKYWSAVKHSLIYKLYYGLQTLPKRAYAFFLQVRADDWKVQHVPNIVKAVEDDINCNISTIKRQLSDTYKKLGHIVAHKDKLGELNPDDYRLAAVQSLEPGFWTRYWIPLVLAVLIGPTLSFKVVRNRSRILDWLNNNVRDVAVGFYDNWLIKPVGDVINIIKQDSNIIAAKESLNSSVSSLERMVRDYITDNHIPVQEVDLKHQLELGDLTLIMSKYEKEMKSPVRNLVNGTLIRSLLIQIQKTKVDGDLVINGIDKLMKSQQLLLGIVSISPSIFIVYQLAKYLSRPNFIINGKDLKKSCLGNLVGLQLDDDDESRGVLLVNTINLKIESRLFLSKSVFTMLEEDLNRLLAGEDTLMKLYVVYSGYFQ
ncbi:Nuclear control of ATPase protein 2 [Yamadazyma tenuis]|uniref:NCA2-domain-containing protein n=1 Tax=Candida tenuis (strain ATCC 10573 / BCRC 21748 / CBS 615 / JCM 9827 / NBRC 10315 / NRRL Y-1498 / VKM Y-70) TaxID=590646 RepID=G3B821_CANTC|nr:NCA2-domain-containing protein [Yamadazyma tenuis ATCC 10573]EGV62332.1 NCA2-domain-containing protein [Yamadazyma tenuis ATCC 10573]WEJ93596.1 Nuclear control of ATPase protein 2 [Yamadazyma tenuis]